MSSIPQTSGIYKIVCVPTGKMYVGSSVDLRRRWMSHRCNLRGNRHTNQHLQNAWNRYGEQAFEFYVIELVLSSFLVEREQYWIDKLRACGKEGLNLAPNAGSALGRKVSEETRSKLREVNIARVPHPNSIKALRSDGMKGRKHSDETRRKMSLAHIGVPKPNVKRRMPMTEVARANMRASARARGVVPGEHARRALKEVSCKQWIAIDPNGTEHFVHDLPAFCREHALTARSMREVARGDICHHRNWRCRHVE